MEGTPVSVPMGKPGTENSQTISGAVRTLDDKEGVKEEGHIAGSVSGVLAEQP